MFKRVRWLFFGAVIGVGGYLWARGQVKQAAPQGGELLSSAQENLRGISGRLTDALVAGREAMRDEQVRLEREILGGNGSVEMNRGPG